MRSTCERIREWLETREGDEPNDLRAHVATCLECGAFEEDVRASRDAFARLPRPACPDRVVTRIWASVDATPRVAPPEPRRTRALWWAALPAAAALALVVWFGMAPPPKSPIVATANDDSPTYTEEEVAVATEEARVAFTLLSRAMKSTATVVGDEVRHRLTTPIVEGMEKTWDCMPAPFERPSHDGAAVESAARSHHA